jgi:hypothetical protein
MDANLSRAKAAVDRFEAALGSAAGFDETLANEYKRARLALATNFQKMSLNALSRDQFGLDDLRAQVQDRMRQLFSGRVDSGLFVVHGYTSPHPDLYAYLASRVGDVVPAWRLRLLTRDAIHTERRTRELRDFGLHIDAIEEDSEAHYSLQSLSADLTYGAAFQLRKNASKSKHLTEHARADIINLAERAAPLPVSRRRMS